MTRTLQDVTGAVLRQFPGVTGGSGRFSDEGMDLHYDDVNVRMLIHEFYMSGFAMCVFAASAAILCVRRL